MRVATDDVHSDFSTSKAKEEETLGNAVDDDIEGISGCYRASEYAIGYAAR